jgi:hypothetical protein
MGQRDDVNDFDDGTKERLLLDSITCRLVSLVFSSYDF